MYNYYKCASVKDALDISKVTSYNGNRDRLVKYGQTYKDTTLGVICADPTITGITYEADEHIVATQDLLPIELQLKKPKVGVLKTNPYLFDTVEKSDQITSKAEHVLEGFFDCDETPFIYQTTEEVIHNLPDGSSSTILNIGSVQTTCPSSLFIVESASRIVRVFNKNGNELAYYGGANTTTIPIETEDTELIIKIHYSCYLSTSESVSLSEKVTITQECPITINYTAVSFSYHEWAPLAYLNGESPESFLPLSQAPSSCWLINNFSNVQHSSANSEIDVYLQYDSSLTETFSTTGLVVYLHDFMPNTTWSNFQITSVTTIANPGTDREKSATSNQSSDMNAFFGIRSNNIYNKSEHLKTCVCKNFPYGNINDVYNTPPAVIGSSVLIDGIDFSEGTEEPFCAAKVTFDVSYDVANVTKNHTFTVNIYLIVPLDSVDEDPDDDLDTDPEIPDYGGLSPAYKYKTKDGQIIEEANQMISYDWQLGDNYNATPIVYEALQVQGNDGYIYVYLPAEHVQYGFFGLGIFTHKTSDGHLGNDNLTHFVFLADYKIIQSYSFYRCTSLRTVRFPKSLQSISYHAFRECKALEKLNFTKLETNVMTFMSYCFMDAPRMTQIQFSSDKHIDIVIYGSVFENCINLLDVTGDFTVAALGPASFKHCINLTTDICKKFNPNQELYHYQNGDKYHSFQLIPDQCFMDCFNMKTVTICNNAHTYYTLDYGVSIWDLPILTKSTDAFKNCGMEKLIIEGSQYRYLRCGFSSYTFKGCKKVTEMWCDSERVPFMGAQNIWYAGAINPQTCILHVPKGLKDKYGRHAQWGDFGTYENIKDDIESDI